MTSRSPLTHKGKLHILFPEKGLLPNSTYPQKGLLITERNKRLHLIFWGLLVILSQAAYTCAADLIIGDTPGEIFTIDVGTSYSQAGDIFIIGTGTLLVKGELLLTGTVYVSGTGSLTVDGGEFHLMGDDTNIIVYQDGRVIFDNNALLHYVQTYVSQHTIICWDNARVYCLNTTFGYEIHPSESEPEAFDSALALYLELEGPSAAELGQTLDIRGSAWIKTGPLSPVTFNSYELAVSPEGSTEWEIIENSVSSIKNGVLGAWHTSGLSAGSYRVRLTLWMAIRAPILPMNSRLRWSFSSHPRVGAEAAEECALFQHFLTEANIFFMTSGNAAWGLAVKGS